MKKLLLFFLFFLILDFTYAQKTDNYIAATIDGKAWKAEAKRLKFKFKNMKYLSLAGFEVNPDVQVWIRIWHQGDAPKPGTYPIEDLEEMEKRKYRPKSAGEVWALVDYTEETKKMGHGFHDGESMSGTITITASTPTSIEGTFEANLKGVYYKKRTLATLTGSGLRDNLQRKVLTGAGAGVIANGDPHNHDRAKKLKETDSIKVTDGKFSVDWTKEDQ